MPALTIQHFAARGGNLVYLAVLVYLIYSVCLVRQTKKHDRPDDLPVYGRWTLT